MVLTKMVSHLLRGGGFDEKGHPGTRGRCEVGRVHLQCALASSFSRTKQIFAKKREERKLQYIARLSDWLAAASM